MTVRDLKLRIQGANGTDWELLGGVEGDNGIVFTAERDTPTPTDIDGKFSVPMTVASFDYEAWEAAEQRFRRQRKAMIDGISALADVIRDGMANVEAATEAMKAATPKPKHTPPFWAHNPTKQKRPRR